MSGVTYLHDLRDPHGDLKGCVQTPSGVFRLRQPVRARVLVDEMGTAHVADFGLVTITGPGYDLFI